MKNALVVLILVLILAACAPVEEADEFTVGVIVSLTGPAGESGEDFYQGMQLAMEEHDIDVKFEVQDSKSNPRDGLTAAQQLLVQEDIDAFISVLSTVSVPVASFAEENQIPLLASLVANNEFAKSSPYAFRLFANGGAEANKVISYLEGNGIQKVAILHLNDEYGKSIADQFTSTFTGEIVATETYEAADRDFKTQLLKIKEAEPEFIYVLGFPAHDVLIVRQKQELEIEAPLIGNVALTGRFTAEKVKELQELYYGTSYLGMDAGIPESKDFIERYTARFGKAPDFPASFGYETVLIMDAVQKAGKDPLTALKEISMDGINGKIEFDEDGESNTPLVMVKVLGTEFERV